MPKYNNRRGYLRNYYNAVAHGRIRPNLDIKTLPPPPRPAGPGPCSCAGCKVKFTVKYASKN
tara:strand:+ start:32 stop:217 length:186 start_codon:yes stop_codon:yes gene_type:complete